MNPYLPPVWNQSLREGRHGGACALQDPALDLDNGRDWTVDMGRVCVLADEHRDVAFSVRMDVRIHGDREAALKAQCREITTQRFMPPPADGE